MFLIPFYPRSRMSEVVYFPPLPPIPKPPSVPLDERQQQFYRITVGLLTQLSGEGEVATTNMAHGFRACAVDLGILQDIINDALAPFDMNQIRERWDADLFRWLTHVLKSWIQRCKEMHFDLAENGIRIRFETQDDRGHYQYEFDVFPGK